MVCGDKGYLCAKKADELAQKGILMITKVKKNIKKETYLGFKSSVFQSGV
jgi:hypothetical protein